MNKVLALLKREPVAVYGSVIALLLGIPPLAGAPEWVPALIAGIFTALGIPVVRNKVSPA